MGGVQRAMYFAFCVLCFAFGAWTSDPYGLPYNEVVAGSHLFRAAAGTRLLIRGFGHHVPMLLLPTFQNFVTVLFHVISYSL